MMKMDSKFVILSVLEVDAIYKELQLTKQSFVDLCLMSGCDFSKNMPGYAVIKSFNLIKKHGSIDNLPSHFHTECSDH